MYKEKLTFVIRYGKYKSKIYRQDLIDEAYHQQWLRIKDLPTSLIHLIQNRDIYLNRLEKKSR